MQGIQITGMGKALPKRCVTNEELAGMVDTSDAWIYSRTGIRTRYYCGEETLADLAAEAAKKAMASAGVQPDEIGICVVATITADHHTPSAACMVQAALGLHGDIPAFDINAACSGFLYGLNVVSSMLGAADLSRPYALLIGGEKLSRIMNFEDRSTCVLFGDGAAAAVIRKSQTHRFFCRLGASGDQSALNAPGVGYPEPYIHMDGRKVFQFAVGAIDRGISLLETETGIRAEDVDEIICHQANARIIDHVRKKRSLPDDLFFMNMDRYGNTSGASVPLVMAELMEKGRLSKGERAFCLGFGGGLTWGAAYLEF